MSPQLDFDSLDLQDALDLAIFIEDEAKERYQELADQLEQHSTMDAAEFFRTMVQYEQKHGERLREQRGALFGNTPQKVDSSLLPEVETTDYDAARAFMTQHQALRIALANEVRAFNFYGEAKTRMPDPKVQALFDHLQGQELGHQRMVKAELDKLPPEDDSNPDDFADEPVAQ